MWNQTREAVQVMRTLAKHENIVEMVECFETQTSLYILMQLFSPNSITKMYTSQKNIPISKTKHYFTQVVRGIMHMHDNGVVHSGIAPDHVLVNDRDQVKIGFLVSCRFFQRGKMMTEMRGTSHTVAPEVLRQEPYNPQLADAWSLGILLFFMLNGGQYPHDGANTTKNIMKNKMRSLNPALPVQARELVSQLLTVDPSERLPVADIFQHPWMLEDRAEDDVEFLSRNANAKSSMVESSYDAGSEVLNITLPFGLSQEEEAAYIIQHTWKAYQRKRNATRARGRAASLRLKRVTQTMRTASQLLGGGGNGGLAPRIRSTLGEMAAERRLSRSNSIVVDSSPSPPESSSGSFRSDTTTSHKASSRGGSATVPHFRSAAASSAAAAHGMHYGEQCEHCGRLPPQRILPGKSPYPDVKVDLGLQQNNAVGASGLLPPLPAAPMTTPRLPYPQAKFKLSAKGGFDEVR